MRRRRLGRQRQLRDPPALPRRVPVEQAVHQQRQPSRQLVRPPTLAHHHPRQLAEGIMRHRRDQNLLPGRMERPDPPDRPRLRLPPAAHRPAIVRQADDLLHERQPADQRRQPRQRAARHHHLNAGRPHARRQRPQPRRHAQRRELADHLGCRGPPLPPARQQRLQLAAGQRQIARQRNVVAQLEKIRCLHGLLHQSLPHVRASRHQPAATG